MHSLFIVAEIHEAEPTQNGWAQYAATGRACVVCPCGLDTGFIETAKAAGRYREHAEANLPPAAVRIHPETGEASEVLHDMLGEITRE
ncbi:hypothetical protein ABTX71_01645 [Streptomyces parvulus]|uniref:hypothetical protein n=1 Tax=Streptomyces parvulus TaxID=146923 RepID=UPI00331E8D15